MIPLPLPIPRTPQDPKTLLRNSKVLRAVSLMLVGVGGAIAVLAHRHVKAGESSAGWRPTEGVIVESYVVEIPSGQYGVNNYAAIIRYDYSVGGAACRCNKVSYKHTPLDRKGSQRLADRYPVGRRVTVYYNPANPAQAALEVGVSRGTYLWMYGGAAFLPAMALLVWWMAGRMRKQALAKLQPPQDIFPTAGR